MTDGETVIDGQYIVVLEYGGVTLGEEHLAQTIHRDVSDTQQDRLAESGCNPACVFYRVFPILLIETNISDVTSDLVKSLSKCHLQRKASNSAHQFHRTVTLVKRISVIYVPWSKRETKCTKRIRRQSETCVGVECRLVRSEGRLINLTACWASNAVNRHMISALVINRDSEGCLSLTMKNIAAEERVSWWVLNC